MRECTVIRSKTEGIAACKPRRGVQYSGLGLEWLSGKLLTRKDTPNLPLEVEKPLALRRLTQVLTLRRWNMDFGGSWLDGDGQE